MAFVPALMLLTLSLANGARALGNEGCEAQSLQFTGIAGLTTETVQLIISYSHVASACMAECTAISPSSAIRRLDPNDTDSLAT